MTTLTQTDEDRSLKQRHATMWALGDYTDVASEVIPTLGPVLVSACGVSEGQRVLDVAAGAGNAAIPAARTGASVLATDLTPELLDRGRATAQAQGVDLTWQVGDAEALPCADAEFDVVMSCVGVMFAPHHEASAAELLRVTRPGGTIGLLSWTPAGFIGQMFATMRPYAAAPPPPGSQPPPLWGDVDHVRDLLGDGASELTASTGVLEVDCFDGASGFLDFFKAKYGPTIAAYTGLGGDEDRIAALDRELIELAGRFGRDTAAGYRMDWEYLLVTATRA